MAGTRIPVPEHQNWWNQACTSTRALIFSLFSARPPTWTSTSKDVVLVLLRRQLTGENISFLGCVGGSSQAHLDGNVQFWEKCPFIHLYRNNYRCIQPYNGDMQRSAEINANSVFILIQEKSSSKLHFPWILDSNCAQSTCPQQGGPHGQELLIFASCKVPIPSSLSSCLVMEPDNTGSQPKAWQGQNPLLQDSFSGSCYWLNILWIFLWILHVFTWWEKTSSDFSCCLWKAKIQLLVLTQHHSFFWNCHPSKSWHWLWWDQWNKK